MVPDHLEEILFKIRFLITKCDFLVFKMMDFQGSRTVYTGSMIPF